MQDADPLTPEELEAGGDWVPAIMDVGPGPARGHLTRFVGGSLDGKSMRVSGCAEYWHAPVPSGAAEVYGRRMVGYLPSGEVDCVVMRLVEPK